MTTGFFCLTLMSNRKNSWCLGKSRAVANPREGKEYLKLVDTQLLTAQNYLYHELSLPPLEIPEVTDDSTSGSDATTPDDNKKESKRPFKRRKKGEPTE